MSDGILWEKISGKGRVVVEEVILILVLDKDRLHGEGDISARFRWRGRALYTLRESLIGKGAENIYKDKEYFKTFKKILYSSF